MTVILSILLAPVIIGVLVGLIVGYFVLVDRYPWVNAAVCAATLWSFTSFVIYGLLTQ